MTSGFAAKNALVTGASRGIGRAIALTLCENGMNVHALARDRAALEQLAKAAASHPGRIHRVPCDLLDRPELERVIGEIPTPAVIVNAAGWAPPRTPIRNSTSADWNSTLEVCLHAPMRIIKGVLPRMLDADAPGAIVQILSPAARRGRAGEAAYAAAKAGLRGFTEALRDELRGTEIKVVSIYPGHVDTDLIPPNRKVDRSRFLQPRDVAEAVLYCLNTPTHCCPEELVLDPQHDPFRRGS